MTTIIRTPRYTAFQANIDLIKFFYRTMTSAYAGAQVVVVRSINVAVRVAVVSLCCYVAYRVYRWCTFKPPPPPRVLLEHLDFVREDEVDPIEDYEMEGAHVSNAMTEPLFRLEEGETLDIANCDVCGGERKCQDEGVDVFVSHSEVVCTLCGKKTRQRGKQRARHTRGSFNLVRAAQRQFPQRLNSAYPELARQQVYTYMLREAQRLSWTIRAQENLPVLAALAMLPGRSDVQARLVERSELAEILRADYRQAGLPKPARTWAEYLGAVYRLLKGDA